MCTGTCVAPDVCECDIDWTRTTCDSRNQTCPLILFKLHFLAIGTPFKELMDGLTNVHVMLVGQVSRESAIVYVYLLKV